ncbi:type VII toxin-antitoxin system MntA family adenylyltransferase antitoxin [Fonticella tunisiensis]|uniref:type VII toxin-antitoxin system MntA family adenylyltransferase antitoxin n=1 Tax=Fonticella tunisiensis TaxID=1096341 RepID=UPI001A9AD150|nr:nucleotidyltransferase domain-containing protein [Fonticella tunisiensis]
MGKTNGIKLLYIFGSYAKGENTQGSDVDIAVLLEHNYNPLDKINILGDLIDILKRDDIDLVILNSSNSVLSYRVIKYEKVVYQESEETKVLFKCKVLKKYMDMEYFRRNQMYYIREWFKSEVEE